MAYDPIHQFHIEKLIPIEIGGVDFSFTNSALFMALTVAGASAFLILSDARPRPGAVALAVGGRDDLRIHRPDAARKRRREGMRFFPFVFTLFMFVLVGNLWGMFPYFFTVTSHIVITGALALSGDPDGASSSASGATAALPQAVRAEWRAGGDPAVHRRDRGPVVPVAPAQPVDPPFRQHARRPHHPEGFAGFVVALGSPAPSASSALSCRWPPPSR